MYYLFEDDSSIRTLHVAVLTSNMCDPNKHYSVIVEITTYYESTEEEDRNKSIPGDYDSKELKV
ncbi:hypothetical protein H5410_013235 [Solanum commersonii]|uniref:Uncharacterized protein n=1 Tax=Solanum commersonii TaxID=4109 RepID=A0A9J6AUJ6_SOLCO|nr:hypothetical protein H5410_013235 [Solanum commersonii]